MKRSILFFLTICVLGAVPQPVQAQHGEGARSGALRVGMAYFDVDGGAGAATLEVTYQVERWQLWRAIPLVGAMVNSDGGAFAYAGLSLPVELPWGLTAIPSFSTGAYRQGRSAELGSALEFRSGIELRRAVSGEGGISLFLYHLSNAGLGLRNPGTEVLGIGYSVRP